MYFFFVVADTHPQLFIYWDSVTASNVSSRCTGWRTKVWCNCNVNPCTSRSAIPDVLVCDEKCFSNTNDNSTTIIYLPSFSIHSSIFTLLSPGLPFFLLVSLFPPSSVSVSGGWVAAVSHGSFDLCFIFDIENNWNGVLEQSKKTRAGGGGSRRRGDKVGMGMMGRTWKVQQINWRTIYSLCAHCHVVR